MREGFSAIRPHLSTRLTRPYFLPALFVGIASLLVPRFSAPQSAQKPKLPRPRQLDAQIERRRDPATGELHLIHPNHGAGNPKDTPDRKLPAMRVQVNLVSVTSSVFGPEGTELRGLPRSDFRVFEDGVEQQIAYFDASTEPASVALVIDASPSVLRESGEMKQAARAMVEHLSPSDEVAVVDFAAHSYLLLPFSRDRDLLERAIARVDVRGLFSDTGGSNIYEAIYFTGRDLFEGRTGRQAIVLLTDGQDSGLGLTLDLASASPQPGLPLNRLTFDDVTRELGASDIEVFAVSTQTRPKVMTPTWLAAHEGQTLLTAAARELGIPAYTLYLAELARRTGGRIYFLREAETLGDTYRQIAKSIRTQYTLGYYPSIASAGAGKPGWRRLRVEVAGHGAARVVHRSAYYVAAQR